MRIFNKALFDSKLTYFFEHFVALIENEDRQVTEVEVASLDKGQDSAWCAHNHMRLFETFQKGDVLVQSYSTVNDLGAQI